MKLLLTNILNVRCKFALLGVIFWAIANPTIAVTGHSSKSITPLDNYDFVGKNLLAVSKSEGEVSHAKCISVASDLRP
ncbi:MAG: hypothetical protein ACYT04_57575, partial [Nostoc sp.]